MTTCLVLGHIRENFVSFANTDGCPLGEEDDDVVFVGHHPGLTSYSVRPVAVTDRSEYHFPASSLDM